MGTWTPCMCVPSCSLSGLSKILTALQSALLWDSQSVEGCLHWTDFSRYPCLPCSGLWTCPCLDFCYLWLCPSLSLHGFFPTPEAIPECLCIQPPYLGGQ